MFSLPFYREPAQLPAPLPEEDEIEAATHTLPTIRSADYGGRLVVIRDIYVVKYGTFVSENEGHALLFVERSLSIPAPRLYAMYRNADKLYIVMQYVPGTELQDVWPSLSNSAKKLLLGQLRLIFQNIRSLSPPAFYGSVEGGPIPHRYFYAQDGNPAITGLFGKEEDFSKAMSLRCSQFWADNGRHGWLSDFFARHLPSALNGHQPTFTHGDFYRRNILVRKVNDHSEIEKYEVVAIIDWESAGWYPAYWEYASSFALFQWFDDWPECFEKFIDPYPSEAALLRLVQQDLGF